MLALVVIFRCVLCIILCSIIFFVTTLRRHRRNSVSFNIWQLVVVCAALMLYIENVIQTKLHVSFTLATSIILDALVVIILYVFISKFSASTKISHAHITTIINTYCTSKMLTSIIIKLGLHIIQLYNSMLSDYYNEVATLLYIYEMPISCEWYLQNVIWHTFDMEMSFALIIEIVLIYSLGVFSISYFAKHYTKLPQFGKMVALCAFVTLPAQYNCYLYSFVDFTTISFISIAYLIFICVVERLNIQRPQKRLPIKHK